jgi:hypothetical protein
VKYKLPEVIESCAWPGGYPIYFLTADGEPLCPHCVEANRQEIEAAMDGWEVVGSDIHWEGEPLICAHCYVEIESAYGPVEEV